jgi:aerobic-type carbon monoxide dehydrogenase small subunit (CoxS/CutS family)
MIQEGDACRMWREAARPVPRSTTCDRGLDPLSGTAWDRGPESPHTEPVATNLRCGREAASQVPEPAASARLVVNGSSRPIVASPVADLAGVLRDAGYTSVKVACGRGECGACTVLIAGRPRLSCVTLAGQVEGEVETAEGLAAENAELRAAFADFGGLQCGFCTPGQVVHATALLRDARARTLDEQEVRHRMSGNICRCTGYMGIVEAILSAGREQRREHS